MLLKYFVVRKRRDVFQPVERNLRWFWSYSAIAIWAKFVLGLKSDFRNLQQICINEKQRWKAWEERKLFPVEARRSEESNGKF